MRCANALPASTMKNLRAELRRKTMISGRSFKQEIVVARVHCTDRVQNNLGEA